MYKSVVEGKGGISARVVADSVSSVNGKRITTFELEYPRFIHGEVMTHRLFSRNAMSSRAVPIKKMIEQVKNTPAMPVHWGKNQPGMQAKEEHEDIKACEDAWRHMAKTVAEGAEVFDNNGLHKQVVNRVVEPFQMMKAVITATEWDNFFWLRLHEDAQPEIYELARCMKEAMDGSEQETLKPGYWHTPYVGHMADEYENLSYYVDNNGHTEMLTEEEALKVSSSCCAQVSFRLLNNSKDKAIDIYNKLAESKPVHASPFEHLATPMAENDYINEWRTVNTPIQPDSWQRGITHSDKKGNLWSGNLQKWIQYRQLVPENTYWGEGK